MGLDIQIYNCDYTETQRKNNSLMTFLYLNTLDDKENADWGGNGGSIKGLTLDEVSLKKMITLATWSLKNNKINTQLIPMYGCFYRPYMYKKESWAKKELDYVGNKNQKILKIEDSTGKTWYILKDSWDWVKHNLKECIKIAESALANPIAKHIIIDWS